MTVLVKGLEDTGGVMRAPFEPLINNGSLLKIQIAEADEALFTKARCNRFFRFEIQKIPVATIRCHSTDLLIEGQQFFATTRRGFVRFAGCVVAKSK